MAVVLAWLCALVGTWIFMLALEIYLGAKVE